MPAIAEERGLYTLWPKQVEAMQLLGLDPDHPNPEPVEELLYGGEAGGGKSMLARALMVTVCTLWPGSRVVLFRRTYTELEDTHLSKIPLEIPDSVAHYVATSHELRFPNGSVGLFRHCNAESDVFNYLSAEFDALLFDEATTFTARMITLLRSRVRSTRRGWRPIILYATNPGNVGHDFFLDGFVDAAEDGTAFLAPADQGGLRRCFLRARLADNPSLDPSEYGKVLAGISDPDLRKAMQDGDWHIFGSQAFPEWREKLHVCEPFTIPSSWTRWGGFDYGYEAPSCHLWFAKGPPRAEGQAPVIYVYRELYRNHMAAPLQALHIKQESADGHLTKVFADPSIWNKPLSGVGPSIADQFIGEGLPMARANNQRLSGVAQVHKALATHELFPPRLQVFPNCTNLIRTLPRLTRDALHPEDVDTEKEDHAYDAMRYGLMGAAGKGSAGMPQVVMG